MTPRQRRALARQLRDELQPDIARLFRNFQATYGRPLTADEIGDFQLAARLTHRIGFHLERLYGKR